MLTSILMTRKQAGSHKEMFIGTVSSFVGGLSRELQNNHPPCHLRLFSLSRFLSPGSILKKCFFFFLGSARKNMPCETQARLASPVSGKEAELERGGGKRNHHKCASRTNAEKDEKKKQ